MIHLSILLNFLSLLSGVCAIALTLLIYKKEKNDSVLCYTCCLGGAFFMLMGLTLKLYFQLNHIPSAGMVHLVYYITATTILTFRLPDIFRNRKGVKDQYKTPEGKKLIKEAIKKEFKLFPPEKIIIVNHNNKKLEGLSIARIGELWNLPPGTQRA